MLDMNLPQERARPRTLGWRRPCSRASPLLRQ